jgi:hypothetical protein
MRRETLRTLWLGTALVVFGLASILSPRSEAIQAHKPAQFFQSDKPAQFFQSDKPAQAFKIEDLAWISGDWETAPGRMQIAEHWT